MIAPPLKWHGGKHYLAPKIVALMPAHVHYVEPYFGGGSVLLAKNPEGVSEVVNDINGELTNFWRVLQAPSQFVEFHRLCEAMPFSEAEWQEAKLEELMTGTTNDGVYTALSFFVRCRQSLAGRMKSFAPLSRNRTRRGMNEQASAWIAAVDGLPAVHERLRRVVILNSDAINVIDQQDGPDTLFYLDPPYVQDTRTAPDVYAHEATIEHHGELLGVINAVKGKVMLSGYDCDLYRSNLHGWERHEFDLPNNSAGGSEKRRMTEVLWCNFKTGEAA